MCAFEIKISCPGCCGSITGFEWQCRSRVGVATLCGEAEFTSPSVPPKKFRARTVTGGYSGQTLSSCVIPLHSYYANFSGAVTYAVNGLGQCITTNGVSGVGEINSASGLNGPQANLVSGWDSAGGSGVQIVSRTTRSSNWTTPLGNCGVCESSWSPTCDSVTESLTSEDTEESAMARVSPVWGPWSSGGCCTSKNLRGAGVFDFNFNESEYRIRVRGSPGALINLVLTFTRSPGAPYEEIRQFVADGPEYGGWRSFTIQAAPGASACLSDVRVYS